MEKRHILIVGVGSVGRRHARNLVSLGCEISCSDPRRDRLDQAATEIPVKLRFDTMESALQSGCAFDGVAVCSPPRYHVSQSLVALDAGIPVLLEKPVSPDYADCLRLFERLEQGGELLLGYTYRWWEPLRRLRDLIRAGKIGRVRLARFTMSAHLADWHPWEPYQEFFMASRELGGGALLDESHFIDLMLWFFGRPERLFARVEKISDLEITTDDFVEVSAVYSNGLRASIHLDLIGRPHEKRVVCVGESGTLQCRFDPNELRFCNTCDPAWEVELYALDRNDMFMGVAREFLDLISGSRRPLTCNIGDGLGVLEIVEACRRSQETGEEIPLLERRI